MHFNERTSPEKILEAIKQEDAERNKGHLKIFLGMAAGVGKTYAMLEEAQLLRRELIDVVVGNIESHGRAEIELLLKELPQIPKKTLLYKDKEFKELDIDSIIRLKPAIVLIDELAYSNIPGSKNAKRWEDVLEILDHGIHVHTTLNVQHIDSLNDKVRSITEIIVRETVPDTVVEKAHSIQLIDLTPDELIQRLKEGKVYTAGQSKIAINHFFQTDKLTALREIVLRYAADKIDIDLKRMVTTKEGKVEWKIQEKFLVAVSHSPHSQKTIRTARRAAFLSNAPWVAVYVNTGKTLSARDEKQLMSNLSFVKELGGEIVAVYDPDIVEGIKKIAYQRQVTEIIIGKTPKNSIWSLFQGPTLLDKLAAECKDMDLRVVRQDKTKIITNKEGFLHSLQSKFSEYLLISFLVCLMGGLSWVALSFFSYRMVEFLFFIGTVALSLVFKQGPLVLAAIIFGLLWGAFFIPPPPGSFIFAADNKIMLFLYMLTIIFIAVRANERRPKKIGGERRKKTLNLEEILKSLSQEPSLPEILISIEERLPQVIEGAYKFVIKNKDGVLNIENGGLTDKEHITAFLAFEKGQKTGWSTDILPLSENLYFPLKNSYGMMGILIYTSLDKRLLTPEEKELIDNICEQLANYLQKYF